MEVDPTRLKHLNILERAGIDPYPAKPPIITHSTLDIKDQFRELESLNIGLAGRIIGKREHKKVVFFDLEDEKDTLQLILQRKNNPLPDYDLVAQTFDTGDIVNAIGEVVKSHKGEVSLDIKELRMLSKALINPPIAQSFIDPELSRKKRYLELMSSPAVRERFRLRHRMIQLMREEFLGLGFLEVETPVLDVNYGGALARPFTTYMQALDKEMYLRISNELYLKKILVGNLGPVFEFSRNFRNEGMDKIHNPEFTLVELYKPYSDYTCMMNMAETVFERIAIDLHGTTKISYQDNIIDFKAPWRRMTIFDGLRQEYGIDPHSISNEDLKNLAISEGVDGKYQRRGDTLLSLFEHKLDSKFIQPTFVMDYPTETSPLAKRHRDNPELAERFECVVSGIKVMNAYTELNDPRDQQKRFEEEVVRRNKGVDQAMPYDEDFLLALKYGLPPMGGIGISVDRMAMILTNTSNIRDIILFPPVRQR